MTYQVPSPNYTAGRARPVRLVVLHTAETDCAIGAARNIAGYLARPTTRASCHYAVDPGEIVAQVAEQDTAWCAPGANADGIQIEQAGRAGFTAEEWASGMCELMLRTQVAPLVADICRRNQIPAVWLTAGQVAAGERGVTDHATVNAAFGQSDHWDCGPGYPAQAVVAMAARLLGQPGRVDPPQPPQEDDMLLVKSDTGTIYWVGGGCKRPVVPAATWPDTEWALGQLVAGGLARWAAPPEQPQGVLDRIPDDPAPTVGVPGDLDAAVARVLARTRLNPGGS